MTRLLVTVLSVLATASAAANPSDNRYEGQEIPFAATSSGTDSEAISTLWNADMNKPETDACGNASGNRTGSSDTITSSSCASDYDFNDIRKLSRAVKKHWRDY